MLHHYTLHLTPATVAETDDRSDTDHPDLVTLVVRDSGDGYSGLTLQGTLDEHRRLAETWLAEVDRITFLRSSAEEAAAVQRDLNLAGIADARAVLTGGA